MARKRYVILGDGAAGMTAAETLRHADASASIAIVSDDPHPAYFRAALTNYLLGELREEQIWAVPPAIDRRLAVAGLLAPAARMDPDGGVVALTQGAAPLGYDGLLVATGSRARAPAFPGNDLWGVATLRTLQDVRW